MDTMRVIVLAGLPAVEKAQIASRLSDLFVNDFTNVVLIDNLSHARVDNSDLGNARLVRVDDFSQVSQTLLGLSQSGAEVVIVAASESLAPDDLLAALDSWRIIYPKPFPNLGDFPKSVAEETYPKPFPNRPQIPKSAEETYPKPFPNRVQISQWDMRLVAVIDDKTCDCFPLLRAQLEDYADVTLRVPVNLSELKELAKWA